MIPFRRSWLAITAYTFKEVVTLGTLLAFLGSGAVIAMLPGASMGGRGMTIWALGVITTGAALLAGLGGIFSPQGLYRSPWLHTLPPSRMGRIAAATVGLWAALGALLLPALLIPLYPWHKYGGEFRTPIRINKTVYKPGPPGILAEPNATVRVKCAPSTPAEKITISPLPHFELDKSNQAARIEISINNGPWRKMGKVGIEAGDLNFFLSPPRPVTGFRLRRAKGTGIWVGFRQGGIQILGAKQPAVLVWFWSWVSAWNLALAATLGLAAAGSILSRPVALLLGAGWAALAIANPTFQPGIPSHQISQGLACGPDLQGGLGWLTLLGALFFIFLLLIKPGNPIREVE